MSVEAIGNGIKTNLGSVKGLKRIYAPKEIAGAVYELPCAVIQHLGTDYNQNMGCTIGKHTFKIQVLVATQDRPSAFDRILDFIARTGDDSVEQKIRADTTLNSSAQAVTVISNSGQGIISWAGVDYLGTEFDLEVYE